MRQNFKSHSQGGIGTIVIVVAIAALALILGAWYFGFIRKYCEEVSPPKIGQHDSDIVQSGGKLYECRSLFEKLKPSLSYPWRSRIEGTRATDETADWKTYRNEKYGFEVKYPSNIHFSASDAKQVIDPANPQKGFYTSPALIFKDQDFRDLVTSPAIFLEIIPRQYNKFGSAEEYRNYLQQETSACFRKFQNEIKITGNTYCRELNLNLISVSGVNVLVNKDESKNLDREIKEAWLIKDGSLFKIKGSKLKNGFGVDQVLSTFKFIK